MNIQPSSSSAASPVKGFRDVSCEETQRFHSVMQKRSVEIICSWKPRGDALTENLTSIAQFYVTVNKHMGKFRISSLFFSTVRGKYSFSHFLSALISSLTQTDFSLFAGFPSSFSVSLTDLGSILQPDPAARSAP